MRAFAAIERGKVGANGVERADALGGVGKVVLIEGPDSESKSLCSASTASVSDACANRFSVTGLPPPKR